MRNGHRGLTVLLAIGCGSAFLRGAFADSGVAAAPITSTQSPTEEVTVEAHREKLSKLRKEINRSVDNFFAAFNKANTVPGYETHCSDEKRGGSHIDHHVCTPRFVNDAQQEETQGFFDNYATIPAANLIYLRSRGYKKRLEELIHNDPQVHQAAVEFDALTQQYAAVGREKVKAN
jgi:hypothetical protein